MPSSYLMRDVIVCIPGITQRAPQGRQGHLERLRRRDPERAAYARRQRQELKLEEDPVDADDVDGITATSVIRDVHLIPGLWKIDGYTKLVRHIEERFDVKHGENLFEFAYDWRATTASPRSWPRRPRAGSRRRAKSGNRDAKLILIGHSMGGLVARHFIECREGWRDTRTLVTIGTPYAGSLYALGTLPTARR